MRKQLHPFALLLFFATLIISTNLVTLAQMDGGAAPPQPPMAEKKPKITRIHGDTLVDDYFWLREKSNPQVLEHLKAEDAYALAMMKPTEALQEKLYKEIEDHPTETVPKSAATIARADLSYKTNPAEAATLYQQIQKDYAGTPAADHAAQMLAKLPH